MVEIYIFFPFKVLNAENEIFGGEILRRGNEELKLIKEQIYGWTECALKLFGRHKQEDGKNYPDHDYMLNLNEVSVLSMLIHPYSKV